MAAVTLTYQKTTNVGAALTMTAPDAVDGIQFNNKAERDLLVINNGSASPVTATVQVTKLLDGLALPDRTLAVPANSIGVIGPLSSVYSQTDGFVRVTFSAVASVTAAVVRPGEAG